MNTCQYISLLKNNIKVSIPISVELLLELLGNLEIKSGPIIVVKVIFPDKVQVVKHSFCIRVMYAIVRCSTIMYCSSFIASSTSTYSNHILQFAIGDTVSIQRKNA